MYRMCLSKQSRRTMSPSLSRTMMEGDEAASARAILGDSGRSLSPGVGVGGMSIGRSFMTRARVVGQSEQEDEALHDMNEVENLLEAYFTLMESTYQSLVSVGE